jgi:micrococcal nuclease
MLGLAGLASFAAIVGLAQGMSLGGTRAEAEFPALGPCTVVDGDTLRCSGERVRLLGIDAPEMPGHCREGRDCAEGDPYASTASLQKAMTGELHIERVGQDHYGRTLAMVAGDRGDLSCWQLRKGRATYKANWDDGGRVAQECPAAAAL